MSKLLGLFVKYSEPHFPRWLRTVETVGRQYAFIKFGEHFDTQPCLSHCSRRPGDPEEEAGLLGPEQQQQHAQD